MSKVYKLAFSKPFSVFQAISEFDHMPILCISGRKKKENFYVKGTEQKEHSRTVHFKLWLTA